MKECALNAFARSRRAALAVAFALAFAVGSALAAPATVERFDAAAWPSLQAALEQPAAVVFTTTDCAYCPAVIARLGRDIERGALRAQLVAVVMDQPPGADDAALLADAHYRPAARLFAFDGPVQALRHRVNPAWRGVTPYVVLLRPGRPALAFTGMPTDADVAGWQQAIGAGR
jgi:hypothetical protein